MRILLTGKNGQVGSELQKALAPLGTLYSFDRAACDLEDEASIRAVVRDVKPDVVVNAAAYTAVDAAENDSERATVINAIAPGILAEEAAKCGAMMIHYSTDYVFDGTADGYYKETTPAFPQSVYGRTKLLGEENIQHIGSRHLIFRTSWVFGIHGSNFAKRILQLAAEKSELRVVSDQIGAPTSAELIANITSRALLQAFRDPQSVKDGIYHLTSQGQTNWHEYACYVVQAALETSRHYRLAPDRIIAVSSNEYPTAAPRPRNSRLDTSKISKTFGLTLPLWKHHVDLFLKEILDGGH
ncbi:dTDP-4-dehydrorhamnose reductase [Rhizobium sp. 1399]|uniref:dTDP-4-dehydrorhamnose reductase n=1 Tax=Rhizobium sp. 1399 TaxID=2817758 RepID=UPI00286075CE|nr:dTDP-4-dehydrorhamnose reductase [Rhizobium sp. 1399]MDR6671386.1 dTDP-4-dehydrorhamnose reductase [Rhizobium sp. 1399]